MKNFIISFRKVIEEDISYRMKWLDDEDIKRSIGFDGVNTKDSNRQWYLSCQKLDKDFYIILSDDEPIGIVGLKNILETSGSAEVFIMIGEKQFQGKGIGEIALKYLVDVSREKQLKSLRLSVNSINLRAINLYKKIGFKIADENDEINMVLNIV